jgi:nucleotide-binding universal stress UspA family protein
VIGTLVAPLDGSPESEASLPVVAEFAHRTGADVVLVTSIYQPAGWGEYQFTIDLDKEARAAQQYLDARRSDLERDGIIVETQVVSGPPAQAIVDFASANHAGVIVMSTHGRSGATRWALGSVADQVLHGTHTPLLLVRSHRQQHGTRPSFARILVPLDGSDLSLSALPLVEEVAQAFGASLILSHSVFPPAMAYPGFEAGAVNQAIWDELMESAEKQVTDVAEDLNRKGFRAKPVVGFGSAVDEILRVAAEESADLIAMSTHGRSGVGRWVLGSVADAVVRRSELPVLVVRPTPD